jgi:hypothetical protein
MVREVRSPVFSTTPGSKLASCLPLSPGARSDPGRRDCPRPTIPCGARVSGDQPAPAARPEPEDDD